MKKNRIAIHSVPRSGSTWLGSIFDSHPEVIYKYQPLFSYAFKDRLSPISTKKEIDSFFLELASSKDDFLDQKVAKEKKIIPHFNKTESHTIVYKEVRYHHILKNLLELDKEIKVIGLVRNPISTICSWWKAPKEFRAERGWKIEREWRFAVKKNMNKPEEFNGYEKWKEMAFLCEELKEQYPDHFYLLEYKDLLQDTEATVKALFTFCDLNFSEQTARFLKESCCSPVQDAYGVFRKKEKDDKWKNELPQEIIQAIYDDLKETVLEKYLK